MLDIPGWNDDRNVKSEIAALRREIAALGRAVGKRGDRTWSAAHDGASDIYEEIRERLAEALPIVRRSARSAGRTVNDNKVAIAVTGLAVIGLAALFFSSRR